MHPSPLLCSAPSQTGARVIRPPTQHTHALQANSHMNTDVFALHCMLGYTEYQHALNAHWLGQRWCPPERLIGQWRRQSQWEELFVLEFGQPCVAMLCFCTTDVVYTRPLTLIVSYQKWKAALDHWNFYVWIENPHCASFRMVFNSSSITKTVKYELFHVLHQS